MTRALAAFSRQRSDDAGIRDRSAPAFFLNALLEAQRPRHDPVATVIVESIHEVARVMGARTVGEWVETTATLARLESIGVDFAQRYLLHRPEPSLDRLALER